MFAGAIKKQYSAFSLIIVLSSMYWKIFRQA